MFKINKRVLSIIICIAFLINLYSLPVMSEAAVFITSPADGSDIYEIGSVEVSASNYMKIVYVLDGKVIAVTDSTSVQLPEDLSYGRHRIEVSAVLNNKTVCSDVSIFKYVKRIINETYQDFNTYSGTAAGISGVEFLMGNPSKLDCSAVTGVSGEGGDKALHVDINTLDAVSTGAPYIESTKFKNFGKGMAKFEFDIKLNNANDRINLSSMHLWNNNGSFISGGYFSGTNVATTTDWMHILISLNYYNKTITAKADDEIIADNMPFGTFAYYTNSQFRLTVVQNAKKVGDKTAGFSIDNFTAVNDVSYDSIKKLTYIRNESETIIEDERVPSDVEKIRVYMNDNLDPVTITSSNVSLETADGTAISVSEVVNNNVEKCIDISTPDGLAADKEILVLLRDTVKYSDGTAFGNKMIERFKTEAENLDTEAKFSVNGNLLVSALQISDGDIVSAEINAKNVTTNTINVTYILSVRCNSRLITMKAQTHSVEPYSTQPLNIELPPLSGINEGCLLEVYLMNCNSISEANAFSKFIVIEN